MRRMWSWHVTCGTQKEMPELQSKTCSEKRCKQQLRSMDLPISDAVLLKTEMGTLVSGFNKVSHNTIHLPQTPWEEVAPIPRRRLVIKHADVRRLSLHLGRLQSPVELPATSCRVGGKSPVMWWQVLAKTMRTVIRLCRLHRRVKHS